MAKIAPNGTAAEWVKFISSALVIPMLTFMFVWIISIERRITRIEANRFTAGDGMRLLELVNGKADRSEVPPPEVREALSEIKTDIRELRQLMRDHVTNHGG